MVGVTVSLGVSASGCCFGLLLLTAGADGDDKKEDVLLAFSLALVVGYWTSERNRQNCAGKKENIHRQE